MKKLVCSMVIAGAICMTHAADYSAFPFAMACTLKTQDAALSANLKNFPFLVRLTNATPAIFTNANVDGSDIRITKADSITPLPFDIARWDKTNQVAEIWVRLDTVSSTSPNQIIKFFYGVPAAVKAAQASTVFDTVSDYVGAWHLEEDVMGMEPQFLNAAEKAGMLSQEMAGTPKNMVAENQISALVGKGVSCNIGTNSYVNLSGANSPRLDLEGVPNSRNTNFTISSWAYLEDTTKGDRTLLGRSRFQYYIGTTNAKPFFTVCVDPYFSGFSGKWHSVACSTSITANTWHQITGVFRPDSMIVYVDGAVAAKDTSSPFFNTWCNLPLLLGNSQGGFSNNLFDSAGVTMPFPGRIDEPRLSKVAHSPAG